MTEILKLSYYPTDSPRVSDVCPAMCGCKNIQDGVEMFSNVFDKFVSLDSIARIDHYYITCMGGVGFFFILQILAQASFVQRMSLLGNALQVQN